MHRIQIWLVGITFLENHFLHEHLAGIGTRSRQVEIAKEEVHLGARITTPSSLDHIGCRTTQIARIAVFIFRCAVWPDQAAKIAIVSTLFQRRYGRVRRVAKLYSRNIEALETVWQVEDLRVRARHKNECR